MTAKKPVEFKILKKNKWGHRFVLEPKERIKFRERCKYNTLSTFCEKGYKCYIDDGVLVGCTADVICPRVLAWDKRHGLEKPYTMVKNRFPNLKPTLFTWHPATQSPGKRRIVLALKRKGYGKGDYDFREVRFCSPDVTPATCAFRTPDGTKQLPVAWAYYDELTKGIAPWMIDRAEDAAWAWWPEKEDKIEK